MKKIGFVTPWYGDRIPGGAETELRDLVKHLSDAGVELEILTTCVEQFQSDWNIDFYSAGLTQEGGISVRRFPVRRRNTRLFDQINAKLMRNERISREEEEIYEREMVNSPALYEYMQGHKEEYGLFVFIPYMFGTTYYGCQVAPEKSVLIPCLHDESYAYMDIFKDKFSKVAGMVFNAAPEQFLAERLYGVSGPTFVTFGIGMDTDYTYDAQRFRNKYHIHTPFVLYAGRKDSGKRVDVLIRYFMEYKKRNPGDLKLVLIGGGDIDIPSEDILDLGFVPAQDKYDAYAAASLFCNPSQFESFSLVIMESWLAGTPVLVNGDCEVTRDFVIRFSGGLYYNTSREFEACVKYILSHHDIALAMGENGKIEVKKRFEWTEIVKKYTAYFKRVGEFTT